MKSFFEFFVNRHLFASTVTVAAIVMGLMALPGINRDTFPVVDLDEMVIYTRYPASSEDIELKITNKIEDKLKTVNGLDQYNSISMQNISVISIKIDPNESDPKAVKDDVRQAVDDVVDFPADLDKKPTVTEIKSSTFPVLEIGFSAPNLSYNELRTIAKSFKEDVEDIDGVNTVQGYGYLSKEMLVAPDPQRLQQFQLSVADVVSTITQKNRRASMGDLVRNDRKLTLVNDNRLNTVERVSDAIIRSNFSGQSVRVGDVAVVTLDYEEPRVHSKIGGVQGISFIVTKSSASDVVTLTNELYAVVDKYSEKYADLTISIANDSSKILKNRLRVMMNNGIIGLGLVILTLWFFLDLKTAFWVSLGIPVSVMGVFALMPILGMTVNVVSLLAIILIIGIVVDDGIIVAENIAKQKEKGLPPAEAAVKGIYDVFKPVLVTILTTIIAFSPMFFMSGVMGKFIFEIPLVITCALLVSLLEVGIALPAHIAHQSHKPHKLARRHQLIKTLRSKYEQVVSVLLRWRYVVLAGFICVFIGTVLYAKAFMHFVLFPDASAIQFMIRLEAEPGITINDLSERVVPIEDALARLPKTELLSFTTRVGMTQDAFLMTEQENLAIIVVDLQPVSIRNRTAREIMEEIKEETKDTPGFQTINYQVEAGGPPVGRPVNVRIISNNDDRRNGVAGEVVRYLEGIRGVESIERDDRVQKNELRVILDDKKLSQIGVSVVTIHQVIRTAFSEILASSFRFEDEDVDITVSFSNDQKNDFSVLNNLLIPNQTGRLIRLSDVGWLIQAPGAPNFYHYNGKRSVTVMGDLDRDQITSTALTKELTKVFNTQNYPDVGFDFGGESKETNDSVADLVRSFYLALFGIFALLVLLFNSLSQPLIVMLTIPFGLMGVIIAFALHGQDLGFISMVGVIGLTGVIVNDSLVLVNHLNTLTESALSPVDRFNQVVLGAGDRFRPIMITSVTTISGLLPLAYGLGGSDPFIAPMALAIGYGLIFSTPLILFLLPALYLIQFDIKTAIKQLWPK